ncbi:MAG TPA: diacylglycerol kinase [Alphaproteobacteria bacterium]|nr:diacylglycerol kinase [Alphaproteobacteria bacterium]HOO50143.1 diacylglycerol kinase [Alphaproteobacteria bacterium]
MTAPQKNTGLKRILKAFGYSVEGLTTAFKSEAAFRQELLLCAIALPLAFLLDVTTIERILMIGSLFIILIAEIINTAFECVIERISNDWHEASKKVKDLGSAAVLLALINAALVWGMIILN